jgi:sigma-E factor negative regulatory protein RseC
VLNASGRIRAIEIDGDERIALVDAGETAACPRCAAGRGCGAGISGSGKRAGPVPVRLEQTFAAVPGDAVSICLRQGALLRAAAVAYGLPLVGALAGGVVAQAAGAGDPASAVCVVLGLAGGIVCARRRARRHDLIAALRPTLQD